jgi:hypothetical protein
MRRWIGWCALSMWLVLSLGALGHAQAPAARGAPQPLQRGALVHRMGTPGDPIEVGVWSYAVDGAKGRLWIVSLDPARVKLGVVPSALPEPLAKLTREVAGDMVAINGGFYDAEQAPMGLVVSGGTRHAKLRRGGGSGVFFVNARGPGIAHRDEDLLRQPLHEAVQSIDRLVHESEVLVNARPDLPRDARSAIAIDWRGHVHLIAAVDERAIASEANGHIQLGPETTTVGPTLWQLAEFLARPVLEGGLGARYALNLDGGFSTALQIRLHGESLSLSGYRGTINAVTARPVR